MQYSAKRSSGRVRGVALWTREETNERGEEVERPPTRRRAGTSSRAYTEPASAIFGTEIVSMEK